MQTRYPTFTNLTEGVVLADAGARYYSGKTGRFISQDPVALRLGSNKEELERFLIDPQKLNAYTYAKNNPVIFTDPDGNEPVKEFAGTVENLMSALNNSPSRVGQSNGLSYLANVGEFGLSSSFKPQPKDGYLNQQQGRYIYTQNNGWMDMSHFMFFAGRAFEYKVGGSDAPVYEAVRDGYLQEISDIAFAPHSAFSYEDLPSDIAGAYHFDQTSDQTLSDQLSSFLNNNLGATSPENAPNYNSLPATHEDIGSKPSSINKTVKPKFTRTKS